MPTASTSSSISNPTPIAKPLAPTPSATTNPAIVSAASATTAPPPAAPLLLPSGIPYEPISALPSAPLPQPPALVESREAQLQASMAQSKRAAAILQPSLDKLDADFPMQIDDPTLPIITSPPRSSISKRSQNVTDC
jgi:hypothetical protein